MLPDNPLPIGALVTVKKGVERGWGSALTHGNMYRIIGYTTPQSGYHWNYIVEFVNSIREEFMHIDTKNQPRDERFPFPTYGIAHDNIELKFDQNDIEFHKAI